MIVKLGSAKHGDVSFIIDDEDFEKIKEWTLRPAANGSGQIYLNMSKTEGPIRMVSYFHRFIMNCDEGMVIDHINGNTLDNRKENLRICTQLQNNWNTGKRKSNCYSKYVGVTWVKSVKKWQACLGNRYLGRFDNEEIAAKAYDTEARKTYGEYARLNFPDETEEIIGVIRQKKTSKYRGVIKDKKTSKWLVSLMVEGKKYTGGRQYNTEEEAARRYDELTKQYRKNPRKYLNFPKE